MLIAGGASGHRRLDQAGGDHVDSDIPRGGFQGGSAGQAEQAGLASCVGGGEEVAVGGLAEHRADGDERSTAAIDDIAAVSIADITTGADATDVHCGVVKFGTSQDRIDPWEEIAARAATRTHRATGCQILTHTQAGTMAEQQLTLLADEGVGPSAVTLGHMDRNPDLALHHRLAATGAFLSYDQIPKPKYATEAPAIQLILELAKAGLHHQIVVGGDFARRSLFTGYGGTPGLSYLPTIFAQRLRDAANRDGLPGPHIVQDVLQRNPRRALSFRPVG